MACIPGSKQTLILSHIAENHPFSSGVCVTSSRSDCRLSGERFTSFKIIVLFRCGPRHVLCEFYMPTLVAFQTKRVINVALCSENNKGRCGRQQKDCLSINLTHFLLVADLPAAPVLFLFNHNVTPVQNLTDQLCCCHRTRDLRKKETRVVFQRMTLTVHHTEEELGTKNVSVMSYILSFGEVQLTFTCCSAVSFFSSR